jgi:glycine betaine/proline transport system ATP-binding protein
MGLSGSGKSTLIRLLNRLIEPSLGRILGQGQGYLGPECAAELREMRARNIGMVFQSVALLPIARFWKMPPSVWKCGASKDERNRPPARRSKRSASPIGLRDIPELSGGMQQRVGLARAHRRRP